MSWTSSFGQFPPPWILAWALGDLETLERSGEGVFCPYWSELRLSPSSCTCMKKPVAAHRVLVGRRATGNNENYLSDEIPAEVLSHVDSPVKQYYIIAQWLAQKAHAPSLTSLSWHVEAGGVCCENLPLAAAMILDSENLVLAQLVYVLDTWFVPRNETSLNPCCLICKMRVLTEVVSKVFPSPELHNSVKYCRLKIQHR